MDGAKKNPDRLNTIAIVTVGLTGSVLVYLSIIGIEAWYLNESSAVDHVAKFGKQAETRATLKAEQVGKITEPRLGVVYGPNNVQLYTTPIDAAKELIIRDAKVDPANLIQVIARSEKATIEPWFGRPRLIVAPPLPVDGAVTPGTPATGQPGTAPGGFDPGATTPAGATTPSGGAPMPSGGAPMPSGGAATPTAPATTPTPAATTPTPAVTTPAPAAGH